MDGFEWDAEKAQSNWRKHGVSFEEAVTVFGDSRAITLQDLDHLTQEERYLTIGCSLQLNLLLVVNTIRHENTRIISARKATRQERKIYKG